MKAVQVLEALTVEDCHAVVRVLLGQVRVHGGALSGHHDVASVRRHGLLMEACRQLEGADDCLRAATAAG